MNRRRRPMNPKLRWDGRSKSWPREHESGPPGGDLNLWMCAEDLGTEIWSQFHRLEKGRHTYERQPIFFVNSSDGLEDVLKDAIPYSHYGRDLSSLVVGFAQ